jgi:hypothetical protein
MTAGLFSNADKLNARATDPKTRPRTTHPSRSAVPRKFSQEFRIFATAAKWQRLCSYQPYKTREGVAPFGAATAINRFCG